MGTVKLYTGWDSQVVHWWGQSSCTLVGTDKLYTGLGRSSCTLIGTVNLYTGGDGQVVH